MTSSEAPRTTNDNARVANARVSNEGCLSAGWLKCEQFTPLLAELLATVVKQYRVEESAARELLCESLSGSGLSSVVDGAKYTGDIRRTRVYKDAAAAAKRHVYHTLRRYRADDDEYDAWIAQLRDGGTSMAGNELATIVSGLLAGHASTRERMANPQQERAFVSFLTRVIGRATNVLDVGCGVQPIRFPFAQFPSLTTYVAVDSNRRSIEAVAAFASATGNAALRPVYNDLSGGWRPVLDELGMQGETSFDVALMLKLVPVVARQAKELLSVLADTPAQRWIVTGSTTSLAKRTSIERREQRVLRRFVAQSGRSVTQEFVFGEEFGFLVEPT